MTKIYYIPSLFNFTESMKKKEKGTTKNPFCKLFRPFYSVDHDNMQDDFFMTLFHFNHVCI